MIPGDLSNIVRILLPMRKGIPQLEGIATQCQKLKNALTRNTDGRLIHIALCLIVRRQRDGTAKSGGCVSRLSISVLSYPSLNVCLHPVKYNRINEREIKQRRIFNQRSYFTAISTTRVRHAAPLDIVWHSSRVI